MELMYFGATDKPFEISDDSIVVIRVERSMSEDAVNRLRELWTEVTGNKSKIMILEYGSIEGVIYPTESVLEQDLNE